MSTFSIRRAFVASGLILGSTLLFASNAKADGGLNASGDVPVINELTYVTSPVDNGELNPDADNTIQFGTINVRNNNYAGWKLTVTSANKGSLKAEGTAEDIYVAYTLSGNGSTAGVGASAPVSLASTGTAEFYNRNHAAMYNSANGTMRCGTTAGCDIDVSAAVAQADLNGKPNAAYSDTLTFTLSSN